MKPTQQNESEIVVVVVVVAVVVMPALSDLIRYEYYFACIIQYQCSFLLEVGITSKK